MVKRIPMPGSSPSHTRLHDIINRQAVEANREKKRVRTSMYASDFGACQRKVWYEFFPSVYTPDKEIDARTARIFDNGNHVHERLGGYLKREVAIDFHDEVPVPIDSLGVHGRCDGFCTVDGRGTVVEFKSINKDFVEQEKAEHRGQLMYYLGMFAKRQGELRDEFGLEEGAFITDESLMSSEGRKFSDLEPFEQWLLRLSGIPVGEIIYESKPTNEIFSFGPIEFDKEEFENIRLWFEQLKGYVESAERPPVHWKKTGYPCMWHSRGGGEPQRCPFFSHCWGKD